MRYLAKAARDFGITVPLFTNDGWEEGSFIARPEGHTILGKETFGLDLYGFDKYLVFCPSSSPQSLVFGTSSKAWPDWNPENVISGLDSTEKTVRSFGGGAATSPIFIPKLQGGWFNHFTVAHTYDDTYDSHSYDI